MAVQQVDILHLADVPIDLYGLSASKVIPGHVYITCDYGLVAYLGKTKRGQHLTYTLAATTISSPPTYSGKPFIRIAHQPKALPYMRAMAEDIMSSQIDPQDLRTSTVKPRVVAEIFDFSPTYQAWYEDCRLNDPALPELDDGTGLDPAVARVKSKELVVGKAYIMRDCALRSLDGYPPWDYYIYLGRRADGGYMWMWRAMRDGVYTEGDHIALRTNKGLKYFCLPLTVPELANMEIDVYACPKLLAAIDAEMSNTRFW